MAVALAARKHPQFLCLRHVLSEQPCPSQDACFPVFLPIYQVKRDDLHRRSRKRRQEGRSISIPRREAGMRCAKD